MCTARTQIYARVKDPISICRERVGLTAGRMETRKRGIQGGKQSWVAPYHGCSLSQEKAARISRALHWDKKVIISNLTYIWRIKALIIVNAKVKQTQVNSRDREHAARHGTIIIILYHIVIMKPYHILSYHYHVVHIMIVSCHIIIIINS